VDKTKIEQSQTVIAGAITAKTTKHSDLQHADLLKFYGEIGWSPNMHKMYFR